MYNFVLIFIFITWSLNASSYSHLEGKLSQSKKWIEYSSSQKLNLKFLLLYLAKSKTGRELIRSANYKAKSYNLSLYDVIQPGKGSITDTTLIRRFSQSEPDVITYESQSKVFLNDQLSQFDALLDLAHELTHFVHRKPFNPYNTKFDLPGFITSTVEGEGGEVDAFMSECKVLNELFPNRVQNRYNCRKIIKSETGGISRSLAIKKFYSIGPYFSKFRHKLSSHGILEHFPLITNDEVGFVSSAYGMPYPVAAYHEYKTVLTKVCENDKKRIAYMRAGSFGRTPASIAKVKKDYLDRCSKVESYSSK